MPLSMSYLAAISCLANPAAATLAENTQVSVTRADAATFLRAALAHANDAEVASAPQLVAFRRALDKCADWFPASRAVRHTRASLEQLPADETVTNESERVATARRWISRLADTLDFQPRLEASLPAGFPAPTAVGDLELKEYPPYRLARTDMRSRVQVTPFFQLFAHIKKHDIAMTAPVEIAYGDTRKGPSRESSMAFLYAHTELGATGQDGAVEVLDMPAMQVVSIGMRGERTDRRVADAREVLESWIATQPLVATGELRVLGYNSPVVPASARYFEVQIPVAAAPTDAPKVEIGATAQGQPG